MGFLRETVRWRSTLVRLAALGMLLSSSLLRAQLAGAPIFASNCSGCHGADGRGGEHAPNIATAPEVSRLLDRELASIIRNGIAGAGMPAFPSFKQQEVAEVVAYLRYLQGRSEVVKLPGDPHRGESLYFGNAGCSECHMINGKGGFIGSELSFYGADAKLDQLRAILVDPDKNLTVQKKAVTVVTRTGQTTTGMLKLNDNFSLSLQTPDGSFQSFLKSDLTQVDFGSRSLMPPAKLNSKEMDDLISYLLQVGNDNATRTPSHSSNSNDDDN
jgi:cytochrome c oxidase cbb3-type subunit III